jgi:tetratricopeptide (TPR) repeat protein
MPSKHRREMEHALSLREEPEPPVARICQKAIFGIVVLILIVSPLAFGAVRPWSQYPVMLAVAVAGVFWIIRLMAAREAQVVFSPLGAPMLVLATYGIIRYTLAEVEPVARQEMLLVVTLTVLFFLVLNNVRHRWQVTTLVWVATGLGIMLAFWGLCQTILGERWIWWFPQYGAYLGRASGTFVRPGDFVVYLHLIFPLAAANFLFSRRRFNEKAASAFACVLMAAAMMLSFAYTHWIGWLASVLVLAIYVIRRSDKKIRWLLIGSSVVVVVVTVSIITAYALRHSTTSTTDEDSKSLDQEVLQALPDEPSAPSKLSEAPLSPPWKTAILMGQRNLWIGNGPRMFEWLYPFYRTTQRQPQTANNEYLTVFAEYGLVGCLLFAWVIFAFVLAVIQILNVRAARYSAAALSNRYAFAVAGLAAFAAALVDAALGSGVRVGANLFTLTTIMATVLTCGVHHHGDDDDVIDHPGKYTTVRLAGPSRWVIVGGVTMLLLLLGSRLRASYPSYLLMRMAERERAELHWTAAEKHYLQAWRFDHRSFEVARGLGNLYAAHATWSGRQREALSDQALSWYERAFTLNPYAYGVLIREGRIYDALGKREQAFDCYQRALQADPDNSSYHAQLALHYQRWGDEKQALASFHRAYQLGGSDPLPAIELKRLGKAAL